MSEMNKTQKKIDTQNESTEFCPIPRWLQYKSTLDNLDYSSFVNQARANPNAKLIDVRTPAEYNSGSIEGAINIDYLSPTLADELELLDEQHEYYIFCRTGRRSLRVCMLLKNINRKVYNLDEGIVGSNIG